jgi:glutathione synthase/RimK-type ligase-like ATP-grasp enzyme
VEFVMIQSESYDFSHPIAIEPGSALYKTSLDDRSTRVFKTLLDPKVATVFRDPYGAVAFSGSAITATLLYQKAGLPIIPTVLDLPRDRRTLQNYAEYLGGFPIILKASGGSHGVGVMKIDSMDSLASIADYLVAANKSGSNAFMLRKYIDYIAHARVTVLNGKAIDSIEYKRVTGDFRSNVGTEIHVEVKDFGPDTKRAAIGAVESLHADFGGVDLLIDTDGKAYVAEVNVPCFFPRSQQISGVNIAEQLVQFLMEKAARL